MANTKTIDLDVGYTDAGGTLHTRVTFGYRLKGKDLFALDDDPQGQNQTQYNDLIMRAAITQFGTLSMPVPLKVLLDLDSIDREDLARAYAAFREGGLDGRTAEFQSENQVKLPVGFERNGLSYDLVTFGNRLTGMHEVEADNRVLTGVKRSCYFIGRQIAKLSQSNGTCELPGPIELEFFEEWDGGDILILKVAAERWRQSFRASRKKVQGNGSDGGADSHDENQSAGT